MAASVFNVAKGRWAEFYYRVANNDPANSAFVVLALTDSGLESDATLLDRETLASVLGSTTAEVTNTNYARKVLTNSDLDAFAADHSNNRVQLGLPDQQWNLIGSGDDWAKILVAYDPDTTGGTDSSIIPCTLHDFVTSPDGSNITVRFTLDWARAA